MRPVTSSAVLILGLFAIGCDNKNASDTGGAPNTPPPIIQKIVKPINDAQSKSDDAANKLMDDANKAAPAK